MPPNLSWLVVKVWVLHARTDQCNPSTMTDDADRLSQTLVAASMAPLPSGAIWPGP